MRTHKDTRGGYKRLIARSSIILDKDDNQNQNKQNNDDCPEHCVWGKVENRIINLQHVAYTFSPISFLLQWNLRTRDTMGQTIYIVYYIIPILKVK